MQFGPASPEAGYAQPRNPGKRYRATTALAGVATIENGYDETAKIEAVPPEKFEEREKELLVLAKRWMPRLPLPSRWL